MIEFEPISLAHKPLFDELLTWEDSKSSGSSFGNVFLWDLYCRRSVARLGDRLGIEFLCRKGPFYAFPSGRGDLRGAVEALRERARTQGYSPFRMNGVTAPERRALEECFPDRFTFTECRDDFDYICTVESVATLAGKKLHGKRNFCNRFEASYTWSFEDMTKAHFAPCLDLLDEWDREKDGGDAEENRAIRRVFENWDALGMTGGVLFADGAPVAFTIGERIGADIVDIHFEKARADIPGAYPMVAREYARRIAETQPEIRYLNREEDMGLPNIRRAKEEWYPLFLLEKFSAEWRAEP